MEAARTNAELDELIALFYPQPAQLGEFASCSSDQCPPAYRAMLDHDQHMTITVERRHNDSVDVEVLESKQTESHYMRKILLRRQGDGRVVQFGIVRLALNTLQPIVREQILSQRIPLGRVLITHDVLRHVQLNALWRVECGADLANWFDVPVGSVTYGRTALIYCDQRPAVELFEVVVPEDH